MTAVSYPDLVTTSENGRFCLKANSPHNETIERRDGTTPSEDEYSFKYGVHQREFRYRLLDDRDRILWERWQGVEEDSPGELLVSDQGWSILRTHGFNPEIIAVSPDGSGSIRVKIIREDSSTPIPIDSSVWRLRHLASSTVGDLWSWHSWSYSGAHPFGARFEGLFLRR
jgi:hypothetical protein